MTNFLIDIIMNPPWMSCQGKLVDAPNIPHTREKIDVLSSIFSCMRNIYVFKKKMSCMPDIFSPQELLNGWKNYRGWPLISKEHWQLPLPFQPKKEDKEKPFNIDDYLENYNSDMEKWDTAS